VNSIFLASPRYLFRLQIAYHEKRTLYWIGLYDFEARRARNANYA
jgi:hypothetical protein